MAVREALNVILVEDNADLCDGWRMIFELLGHKIRCAQRSREMLEDGDAIRVADVIVTDYYLPDMNGIELITRVRAMRPGIPAILLTGSRDETVVKSAAGLSRCRILHKPVDIERLIAEIESLLAVCS